MRRSEVILERVMVPYHERELARVIASQVLDARLGGPAGGDPMANGPRRR